MTGAGRLLQMGAHGTDGLTGGNATLRGAHDADDSTGGSATLRFNVGDFLRPVYA